MEATLVIILITMISTTLQQAPVSSVGTEDMSEMKTMLMKALAVNRKLDMQNKRLMRVWSGLEQMCNALHVPPDRQVQTAEDQTTLTFDQEVESSNIGNEILPAWKVLDLLKKKVNDDATNNKNADPPLHIRSVRSSGGQIVNLTVSYTAPEDHSTDWFATLDFNGQLRSAGNRQFHSNSVYTVHEAFYEPELLQTINFHLYSGSRSMHLEFDLTELDDDGEQTLPEHPGDIVFSRQQYNAFEDRDVEVIAMLPEVVNPDVISGGLFVFFSGLDYSVYPVEHFRYSNYDKAVMTVTGDANHENGTSAINVTIKSNYARNGGILTVRPPRMEKIGGLVRQLSYEQYVTITSSNSEHVIHVNQVALYPLDKTTVIANHEHSLWCAATGNPKPEVKLLRQLPSGQTKEKRTQIVLADKYTTIVTTTLAFSDKRKGLYICSATSGRHTVEETTEVVFYKELVISPATSRVVKNSSEEVRVTCKASGIPRPEVEARVNSPDGPFLQSWLANTKVDGDETPKTTTLMVTIAQPVQDWPKIFCVGRQHHMNTTKFLQIFPQMDSDDTALV